MINTLTEGEKYANIQSFQRYFKRKVLVPVLNIDHTEIFIFSENLKFPAVAYLVNWLWQKLYSYVNSAQNF